MNALQIIHSLERCGYTLTVEDGKVRGDLPGLLPPPPEAIELLDELRQHKGEVIDALMQRAFTVVPASSGDLYSITFDASDSIQLKRWALAEQIGLIVREGKVVVNRHTGMTTIRFKCAFPADWLPDAITRQAKVEYNRTLERIQKGAEWLDAHRDDAGYAKALDAFMALHERLKELYNVIGEELDDPMSGYDEVRA